MKYQSLYKFYWFGTCLRYLQDASANSEIHGKDYILSNIDAFFKYLKDLQLIVSERVAHHKLDALITELRATDKAARLTQHQATQLAQNISDIRDTLEAELEGIGAYTPTPKRLDIKRLLSNVPDLFAPNVFGHLPEIAKYDLNEAGKCIAFERPTAAAFHILRATEATLREYYSNMIRSQRIKSNLWGPLIIDLRKRPLTRTHEALNNHLDNIRASFRNPTQHPEATYDIHEAQDLWAVCAEVINKMIQVQKSHNRLPSTPPTPPSTPPTPPTTS